MAESLYDILIDEDKRWKYCQDILIERLLQNESFLVDCAFKTVVEHLHCFLKIRGNPFYYDWDGIEYYIQSSVDFYIDLVQGFNENTYGKKTIRAVDFMEPEEYEANKHLLPEPPSNEENGHTNDNVRVAISPY